VADGTVVFENGVIVGSTDVVNQQEQARRELRADAGLFALGRQPSLSEQIALPFTGGYPQAAAVETEAERKAQAGDPPPGYVYQSRGDAGTALAKRFALMPAAAGVSVWDSLLHRELGVTAFNRTMQRHMPKSDRGTRWQAIEILASSHSRLQLAGLMFWPGAPGVFDYEGEKWGNLYKGAPSDETPMAFSAAKDFVRLLRHLFPRAERGRKLNSIPWVKHYIDTLAWLYQNPDERLQVAMILTGRHMGSGKTFLMYQLPKAVLANATKITAREIFTQFNKWIGETRLLFMDEFGVPRTREGLQFELELRDWITGSDLRVVGKGKDGVSTPNCITFFAASNQVDDILPIADTDRRYAIEETAAASQLPPVVAARIAALLRPERPGAPAGTGGAMLRWYLRKRSVQGFNPRFMPETQARAKVKEASAPEAQQVIERLMETPGSPLSQGFATIAQVSEAVRATGYRLPPGLVGSGSNNFWSSHLENAAEARSQRLVKHREQRLPGRPCFWLWGNDEEAVRKAAHRLRHAIGSVLKTQPPALATPNEASK
jgi:hypothetical protein